MKIYFAAFVVFVVVCAFLLFGNSKVEANAFADTFAKLKADDPSIATHTSTGMLIKVLNKGTGDKSPNVNDRCKMHYTGWLLNKDGTKGKKFDSSVDRGQPFMTSPSQVVNGWKIAMQLQNVGDKFELTIPASAAYGSSGAGGVIPPNAALVFTMEMLDVLSGGKSAAEAREKFAAETDKKFEDI